MENEPSLCDILPFTAVYFQNVGESLKTASTVFYGLADVLFQKRMLQ